MRRCGRHANRGEHDRDEGRMASSTPAAASIRTPLRCSLPRPNLRFSSETDRKPCGCCAYVVGPCPTKNYAMKQTNARLVICHLRLTPRDMTGACEPGDRHQRP